MAWSSTLPSRAEDRWRGITPNFAAHSTYCILLASPTYYTTVTLFTPHNAYDSYTLYVVVIYGYSRDSYKANIVMYV
jgi:hypothetical protein